MDRVLQSCCSTLRELHLLFYSNAGEWLCMLFLFRVLTITSDSEDEIPLLTNHHALQRLALLGPSKDVLSVLARLPLLALSSIVSISCTFFRWDEPGLTEVSESELKAVDLALCDSKFSHLTCVQLFEINYRDDEFHSEAIEDPHTSFQRALPKSYMRGILWYRSSEHGMYLIVIMFPHSDLRSPVCPHRSSGCPTIPRASPKWELPNWMNN